MGIAIPQVITSDRASGNQVIDGSLKFDASKSQYLRRTFSAGNRRKSTWSGWVQRASSSASNKHVIFGADGGGDTTRTWMVGYDNTTDDTLRFEDDFTNGDITGKTNAVFRNFSGGWYHVVVALDTTQAAIGDGLKIYVNGELQTLQSTAWNQNQDTNINSAVEHKLGIDTLAGTRYFDGKLAQVYFIDGQALGPEYFGFTDPLTNTWKPKKYTGTFTRSSVNDGTTWSSSVSGTVDSSYPLSNAFGGTIGSSYTSGTRPTVGNTLTFDISSKNLTVAKVRLNTFLSVNNGNATLQVNDTDVTTNLSDGDQTHEITINGQFNNVKWSYDDGNGPYVYMRGIEVDLGTGRGYELLTDGLTDTGANSFYLPFDGNSLIGQDQSGNGNNFTPVNFGGSNSLDEATGAKPILNTTQGGTQAGVGVFGSRENVGYAVTVYDDGGGNKYYIDGVKQATLTGLIRGATYTFDTSDSTIGSTHPFRLSATSAHGTEYTNGVVAITGAATTITIPYDAPESLYYYCTSHSGMGSSITGITTNEKLADQYASNCVLAIPFTNGDVTDVSPSIACTSTKKSLTKQGDPTSSTSFNFYSSSTDFDGTGDYYTSGSETAFTFGTGDFTVEFWVESDDLGGSNQDGYLQISDTSGGLKTGYANGFAIYEGATAGTVNTAGLTASIPSTGRLIKAGVWNHIALVREGTSVRLYANGFLAGSGTSSKDMTASYLALGGYYSTTYVYNGRMQDFRIYKGVAKYNGSFEVPVTSPYILPDTPSGVSGGSKLAKITDGAVAFDGVNDSVSIADHADFTFGSGDFTIEAFVYNRGTGYRSIVQKYGGSPSTSSWFWTMYNGQNQFYYYSGSNEPYVTSGQTHYYKWVHCAVSREGNTIRIFDNGELTGTLDVSSYDTMNDSTVPVDIGADYADNYDMDGYISNVRIVKGTALYTSRFTPPSAPLTNVTNTKLLCCQSPTSATEAAVSPSTPSVVNNAAATNFTPFNTDINTVRGQETGYATFNPLSSANSNANFSDGNLTINKTGTSHSLSYSNIGVSDGKWYWEVTKLTTTGDGGLGFGVHREDKVYPNDGFRTGDGIGQIYLQSDTIYYYDNTATEPSMSSNSTFNDAQGTFMLAYDVKAGKLYFGKDGQWLNGNSGLTGGNPSVGTGALLTALYPAIAEGKTFYPYVSPYSSGQNMSINFGQKPFKFPPPDGFQTINAANVRPETVISRPDKFVTTVIGNFDSTKTHVTGFQPDMIWFKSRSNTDGHMWQDSVRGVNSYLFPVGHGAAGTFPQGGQYGVTSFNKDGWTQGSYGPISNGSMVAWCWKAGGNKNTFNIDDVGYASAAAAGLDGGTLTPSGASIGTKQGFSIIQWEGTNNAKTISHGLSQAPEFIINKNIDSTADYYIGSDYLGTGTWLQYLTLSTDAGEQNNSDVWQQGGAPNATTFGVGSVGNSTGTHIAYLWHSVPGVQKFGKYEGNGNADGPFVELGFRPSLVILKNIDNYSTGYEYFVFDSTRNTVNVMNKALKLELNATDDTADAIDFLSNGFKIRATTNGININAHTIVYMAFAEAPTVDLFGGGANAR